MPGGIRDRDRTLASPFGPAPLKLERFPPAPDDLMAWDAADEYLLDYCAAELEFPGKRVLIADDTFGALSCALSCALSAQNIEAVHYSACAVAGLTRNVSRNGLSPVEQLDWMRIPSERRYDLVLMRIRA